MKYYFVYLLFNLIAIECISQNINDNVWLLGYVIDMPDKLTGGMEIDFSENMPNPVINELKTDLGPYSVYSDNAGKLLIYTEGCKIWTNNHEVAISGDSLGFDSRWPGYCGQGVANLGSELLFLDFPGNNQKVYLFQLKINAGYLNSELLNSEINWNENEQNITVIKKNNLLHRYNLSTYLTAIRHANGRDWWVIVADWKVNMVYTNLFDPEGFHQVDSFALGSVLNSPFNDGMMGATPDGSKIIAYMGLPGFRIFDFDRCTGQVSNIIESGPYPDGQRYGGGIAVSADSRFLYVARTVELWQYDLFANDILASGKLIGTYDGFNSPFPPLATTFHRPILGPDDVIYMSATNGVDYLHRIHHPEKEGDDCDFRQHDFKLPKVNGFFLPNEPQYRTGPLDGSSCDTLGINNVPVADFRYEIDSLFPLRVHFNNTSYFLGTNAVQYQWTFDDGGSSDMNEPDSHDYPHPGGYNVCLYVTNEYGHSQKCREVNLTVTYVYPIGDIPFFSIAPNPFTDLIRISGLPSFSGSGDFILFNSEGQVCIEQKIDLTLSENEVEGGKLSSGVYFYTITLPKGYKISGKLVKI